uniref:ribosomal protein L23 n=1 Tax=Catenella fusiformis TaxID=3024791 RepID=UPI0027DAA9B1|nr:ribosomal protein L23 [Catenella fusiformis]WCH57562.1 ribosomal protein L23 [Catenella fusiformis]
MHKHRKDKNSITEDKLLEFIKYPIITDKSTKLLEENKYTFAVDCKANKTDVKQAIEYIFNVRVRKINTCNQPLQKRHIGKFIGTKSKYKKAIIALHNEYSINLFSDT